MSQHKWLVFLLLVVLLALALSGVAAQDNVTLTLVTHDSFSISEEVLTAFEEQSGITVRILRSGDAGTMVNQAVLSAANPLGDVMYGIDNTFLTRALAAEIFGPYESALLENVPAEFILDSDYQVTPINYGDVCINYDVSYFAENNLAVPENLEALVEPEYEGLLVVENPASSSPGLAFLLTTIEQFGVEDENNTYNYLDYWAELVENDVLVVDDWTDAYYGQFSASSTGTRPLVVSYASSPPAEVFFAEEMPDEAPTGSITETGTCFRQIEFAGILNGAENTEAAQQFIDFMLGKEFQEDLPLQMFVFPVNQEAELPDIFAEYAEIPDEPAYLDIESIDAHREEWITAWTEAVLR
ncbi:thiamine ABC transporter substrate binding subunit [Chloroflexota bacterium]